MAALEELTRAAVGLGPTSNYGEVLGVVEAIVASPYGTAASRAVAVTDVMWRVWPGLVGVSLYRAAPPGGRLVLVANQGAPALLEVPWGAGIVGSTAEDRVVQIVPSVRAFRGYHLIDPAIVSALAAPCTVQRVVYGVVVGWGATAEAVGPVEADLLQSVAERLGGLWRAGSSDEVARP